MSTFESLVGAILLIGGCGGFLLVAVGATAVAYAYGLVKGWAMKE